MNNYYSLKISICESNATKDNKNYNDNNNTVIIKASNNEYNIMKRQ